MSSTIPAPLGLGEPRWAGLFASIGGRLVLIFVLSALFGGLGYLYFDESRRGIVMLPGSLTSTTQPVKITAQEGELIGTWSRIMSPTDRNQCRATDPTGKDLGPGQGDEFQSVRYEFDTFRPYQHWVAASSGTYVVTCDSSIFQVGRAVTDAQPYYSSPSYAMAIGLVVVSILSFPATVPGLLLLVVALIAYIATNSKGQRAPATKLRRRLNRHISRAVVGFMLCGSFVLSVVAIYIALVMSGEDVSAGPPDQLTWTAIYFAIAAFVLNFLVAALSVVGAIMTSRKGKAIDAAAAAAAPPAPAWAPGGSAPAQPVPTQPVPQPMPEQQVPAQHVPAQHVPAQPATPVQAAPAAPITPAQAAPAQVAPAQAPGAQAPEQGSPSSGAGTHPAPPN